jgi:hypothetical protein
MLTIIAKVKLSKFSLPKIYLECFQIKDWINCSENKNGAFSRIKMMKFLSKDFV